MFKFKDYLTHKVLFKSSLAATFRRERKRESMGIIKVASSDGTQWAQGLVFASLAGLFFSFAIFVID